MGTSQLYYSLQVGHTEENLTPRFAEVGVEPTSLTQLKTTLYSLDTPKSPIVRKISSKYINIVVKIFYSAWYTN